MRRTRFVAAYIALAVFMTIVPPVGGGMLIGSSGGVFYDIDPLTGVASNPRDTGLNHVLGLAFSPDGTLYAADEDSLYHLDLATGAPELVGIPGQRVVKHDFGFDSTTGMLFSSGTRPYQGSVYQAIYSINPNTATSSLVGNGGGGPLAFDGDGQMFLHSASLDTLFLLNKENAQIVATIPLDTDLGKAALSITEEGVNFIVDGGVNGTDSLYTIDLSTGMLTCVGHTGLASGLTTLAYIPEPGTLMVLAAGAVVVTRSKIIGQALKGE